MTTKTKREKQTPVPKRRKPAVVETGNGAAVAEPSPGPDLSHIAADLHPLAVLVGDIAFDPRNARLHPEPNLEALKGSLAVYGQRKPIVVNRRTHHIEAGNGTLQAALLLGWTHLAVVWVDDDPARAAGFSVADNQTAALASWDQKMLDELLRDIDTGCDPRLDAMLSDLAKQEGVVPEPKPEAPNDAAQGIPEQFGIIVQCKDEEQQRELLERFTEEGMECRALVS